MKYEVGDTVAFVGKVINSDEADNADNYNEYFVQQDEPWFSVFKENELQPYVDINNIVAKIKEQIAVYKNWQEHIENAGNYSESVDTAIAELELVLKWIEGKEE